jgi:two-component system KDP operon response regulator KdpE
MSAAPLKVLVVDDEPPIRKLLRMGLSTQGYEILEASNGKMSLELLEQKPDLVILDLGLPDMQGLELLRMMRSRNEAVPIVVLSSRGDEVGKVQALDLGADDYITKPFSVRELLARVRAVMRRADETMGKTYEDDHLLIDFDDIRVVCDGVKIKLTNKEFTLLSVLARSADRVVTRQQLLDSVWGYSYYGDARTLDVHIRRLRQKLDKCGDCIETVVGVGYRFIGCTGQEAASGQSN